MNKNIVWIVVAVLVIGGLYMFTSKPSEVSVVVETEDVIVKEDVVEQAPMSFFVTSKNPGTGANFGGLAGADQHCQALANAAGAGDKTWSAYLSATAEGDAEPVHARDRIGAGPWYNFNGDIIANSVEELHGDNNLTKETAISETGDIINGRGDTPNRHDILTGSDLAGMAIAEDDDTTCSNWTSEGEGSAIVGHHDRMGLDEMPPALSWNSSHGSRGCSLENLNGTGGDGLLYCFAI